MQYNGISSVVKVVGQSSQGPVYKIGLIKDLGTGYSYSSLRAALRSDVAIYDMGDTTCHG